MNKHDANKLAATITKKQLEKMFNNAKTGIVDWRVKSKLNGGMTKGAAWNILYPAFLEGGIRGRDFVVRNMILEFGDFLPEELKPEKTQKEKMILHHEDPIF